MRGSTRKRGMTWTAYFDAPADLQTGERRQKTKGGFRTQKEAQQFLADVVTQLGAGNYTEPSKQPLARFMRDEWLPAARGQLRPLTVAKYEQLVRTHVNRTRDRQRPALSARPIAPERALQRVGA